MLKRKIIVATGLMLLTAACTDGEGDQLEESGQEEAGSETEGSDDGLYLEEGGTDEEMTSVTAEMYNTNSERVGTAVFDEGDEGVTLTLNLEDVPAGEYGMHIHEVGQATPPSFEDAGGHFNPTDAEHGFDNEAGHHLGDLPNLEVPENGIVNLVLEIPDVTLLPDEEHTLATEEGTSLIIHTEADDYETDPSGDSGERMIGGVIFAPQD